MPFKHPRYKLYKSQKNFPNENKCIRDGTLKNQPNKMGTTPQHICVIGKLHALMRIDFVLKSRLALELFLGYHCLNKSCNEEKERKKKGKKGEKGKKGRKRERERKEGRRKKEKGRKKDAV